MMQTSIFISSKLVKFNKHLASIASLLNEVSTAIKCSVSLLDNYACSRSNGGTTPHLIKRQLQKSAISDQSEASHSLL